MRTLTIILLLCVMTSVSAQIIPDNTPVVVRRFYTLTMPYQEDSNPVLPTVEAVTIKGGDSLWIAIVNFKDTMKVERLVKVSWVEISECLDRVQERRAMWKWPYLNAWRYKGKLYDGNGVEIEKAVQK